MDYEKESEVKPSLDVFKPVVGEHKIVILSEPEETEYKEDGKEPKPQIKMVVEVGDGDDKKQMVWFVGKGETFKSCYKQLMLVGKSKEKLAGEVITLLVNEGNDKKKQYTIREAISLIPKKEEVVE